MYTFILKQKDIYIYATFIQKKVKTGKYAKVFLMTTGCTYFILKKEKQKAYL